MDLLVRGSAIFRAEAAAVSQGRTTHAYLIEGAAGVGKRSLALAIACAYFCSASEKPCFACEGCRKVLHGTHADVHLIEPDGEVMKVEQIRQLLPSVYETAYEGGKKVYVLNCFHKANEQAQNALLKTLEEPPQSAVFFLLAESAAVLLPTIRSRCRLLRLNGFPEEEILRQLEERFPEKSGLKDAAKECGGNIGKAIGLLDDPEYWRVRELVQSVLDGLADGKLTEPALASLLEKEKGTLLLSVLEEQLQKQLLSGGDPAALLSRIRAVNEAQQAKKKNVNGGLAAEELAIALVKGGKAWQR